MISGVERRDIEELTPGELARVLVEAEEDCELQELRVAVLGWRGVELPSGEAQEVHGD